MTENEKKNKELAELLGVKWKDVELEEGWNPDFTTREGRVYLLELMMEKLPREDFFRFIRTVGFGSSSDDYWYVYGKYLVDENTGKLLDAYLDWLRREK